MNAARCEREDELLDALQRGYIPTDLVTHLDACASCSELHLVAGALLSDRVQAIAEAPIPSAGAMWWRIQLRRRQDAEAASRRSLWVGQAATLAVGLLLVAALFSLDIADGLRHALTSIHLSTPLLLGLALWLVLAPVAGWVAIRQK